MSIKVIVFYSVTLVSIFFEIIKYIFHTCIPLGNNNNDNNNINNNNNTINI